MSVVVPTRYEFDVALEVRLQQPIGGDSTGEIRTLLDNGTHVYATAGRRTLLEDSPTFEHVTTVANASAYEDLFFAWVELSESTAIITWTAWTDDAAIQVQVYDDVGKVSSLASGSDSGTGTGEELDGGVVVSSRTGTHVRIDVRYKAGDATPANSALYNITIFEADLVVANLPT